MNAEQLASFRAAINCWPGVSSQYGSSALIDFQIAIERTMSAFRIEPAADCDAYRRFVNAVHRCVGLKV
ncbi:MAG: hypothetical protein K0Q64_1068 [Nitrobacter vulgaris]|jgi:hypothetical protein|nr:hypothetical protein [Nitrobacter vulgaris]